MLTCWFVVSFVPLRPNSCKSASHLFLSIADVKHAILRPSSPQFSRAQQGVASAGLVRVVDLVISSQCGGSSRLCKEVLQEWNTYRVGVLQRGTGADISMRNMDIVQNYPRGPLQKLRFQNSEFESKLRVEIL